MKTLLAVLSAVGLSGCAVYPVSSYDRYATSGPYMSPYAEPYLAPYPVPYVLAPPLYLHGTIVYRHDVYPRVHPRSHRPVHPGVVAPHARPPVPGPRPRDRNRGGTPNGPDRDRNHDRAHDGDGVPRRGDHRQRDTP